MEGCISFKVREETGSESGDEMGCQRRWNRRSERHMSMTRREGGRVGVYGNYFIAVTMMELKRERERYA